MLPLEKQIKINSIICESCHGSEFYSKEMIEVLYERLDILYKSFEASEYVNTNPIKLVNDYIKSTVNIRHSYFEKFMGEIDFFPKYEGIYRTGYAALALKEAMCAGYAEAVRVLLAMYDIKTHTLLAKLPGANKQLLHYVVVAEDKDGTYKILDPERQANCEKKGYDFNKYMDSMIYIIPDEQFSNNKLGENGVGERAEDFLKRPTTISCNGIEGAIQLVEIIKKGNENNVSENQGRKI